MKWKSSRQVRYIIIDGSGSNKTVYWWSDVEQWLKKYSLEIEKRETKYSADFATIFIYVKPIKIN